MEELSSNELLFKKLSEFARKNRKTLKSAEQWLNDFDGNDEDAWISAGNPFDWRKIVFIAWLGSDEKIYECKLEINGLDLRQWCGCDRKEEDIELTPQKDFWHGVIFRFVSVHPNSTTKHPSFYLIRSALNEGIKAVKDGNKKKNEAPKDLLRIVVAIQKFHVSRATVKRAIKDGKIKSYRLPKSPKNSPHLVSESEVASYFPRLK